MTEPRLFAPTPAGLAEALERYVLVYGTDTVWDTLEMIPMRVSALRLAIGRELAQDWLQCAERRMVRPDQVVFDPTQSCGVECVNLYRGMSLQAAPGDFQPLLELLNHLVEAAGATDQERWAVREFVLNWLALPLQQPGTKMASALVFHGPQGTGKNLFFEAVMRIYGEYGATIGQSQLESKYNDWASRKLFLIADEVVASNELQHFKNALKSLITGETIQIETKYQPLRVERNHANLVFLSNEIRPLALERDDRRHCVIYTPPKLSAEFYARVRAALEAGAIEAFYDFLLRRDLDGFHAHTPPPMTGAKGELIELGLKPAERFAHEWLNGELELPLHPCSGQQLYTAFKRWCHANGERLPPNQALFSGALRRYAGDRLQLRVVSPSTGEPGASLRMMLPSGTGPMPGVRWYDFAIDSVQDFDRHLARFLRPHLEATE